MILAVTANDETNMAVCLLASQLFNIPTRIARVRNQELRQYPRLLAEEGFQITSTIWPEQALNESLLRLIEFPDSCSANVMIRRVSPFKSAGDW